MFATPLDVEGEELAFGRPARQTKRSRPSTADGRVSYPVQSGFTSDAASNRGSPERSYASAPTLAPSRLDSPYDSGEEEDWDEITAPPVADDDGGDAEKAEEIDVNAFEAEMNEQLEASDDDFAAAVSSETESAAVSQPMTLNQIASRVADISQDEDDYSSSESEED